MADSQDAGAPAWVMTFADLMSLLLAFFVLLFSFSELDKQMYKQVAGSMRDAFGVQREVRTKEPPKGINIIAQEFSPGKTQPTPLNQVRQFTTQDSLRYPVLSEAKKKQRGKPAADSQVEIDQQRIRLALEDEIADGMIEIEITDRKIIVRIREKGSFPSGSQRLERHFEPVIERLATTLRKTTGSIVISGHTDSIPIDNAKFHSNWGLSAARAASVAQVLLRDDLIPQTRVHLEGYADTQPVDANDSEEGRAKNRRVELSLVYGEDILHEEEKATEVDSAPHDESVQGGPEE